MSDNNSSFPSPSLFNGSSIDTSPLILLLFRKNISISFSIHLDAYVASFILEQGCCKIPAAEFEEVILPYFDIDLDTFREMAQYDAEGDYYPWRQIQTNDFVFLYYYMVEPEVTGYKVNTDGTITVTVEMLSTDLAMDCLFAHEVTVRPLENGRFQYMIKKITYQTEYGLPYCEPRLTWGPQR